MPNMTTLTSLTDFLHNEVFYLTDDNCCGSLTKVTTDNFSCQYHNFENCVDCLWVIIKKIMCAGLVAPFIYAKILLIIFIMYI